MGKSGAQRVREYRARQHELNLPDVTRRFQDEHKRAYRRKCSAKERPFTGCDGEGAGIDAKGRQFYMLFRMGERELFTGKPLTSVELLDFICDHPKGEILVGFSFGYDVTMILRDLPVSQQNRLFERRNFSEGFSPYTWYRHFDIEYLPKQYFKVRRVKIYLDEQGRERREVIKNSTRTIFETFGFFQKSFIRTIKDFQIGTEEQRQEIAAEKDRRGDFQTITQRERDYCAMECRFLAELMEKLRDYCDAAAIRPRTWNGAGKLADALHRTHGTPLRKEVEPLLPIPVMDLANMAYYGGRFEITRTGKISQPVFEYDIHSAYPAAMRKLPCLIHGTWNAATSRELQTHSDYYVAYTKFKGSLNKNFGFGQLGAFPVRTKEGHLHWPLEGAGVYWSPEIESAKRLGFSVKLSGGWIYNKECDCQPFDWVEPLFDYRRSIGSQGPGYPIKLGINALYGLLVQRVGNGKFVSMIWGGLITAITRAMINDAIALDPDNIVMCATDAVYSLRPLKLDIGERLGQWEEQHLQDLFIVQPGLYWSPDLRKKKSRGLSGKFFETNQLTEKFEREWRYFYAQENSKAFSGSFPAVSVPVPNFIGLRLALARGKPELAGCWISDHRDISFDYRNKRTAHIRNNEHFITGIKRGGPKIVSLPHKDFLAAGGQEPWEQARLMLEEQPDYTDVSIPFKD